MASGITSGGNVGSSMIDGTRCNHFFFVQASDDLELELRCCCRRRCWCCSSHPLLLPVLSAAILLTSLRATLFAAIPGKLSLPILELAGWLPVGSDLPTEFLRWTKGGGRPKPIAATKMMLRIREGCPSTDCGHVFLAIDDSCNFNY